MQPIDRYRRHIAALVVSVLGVFALLLTGPGAPVKASVTDIDAEENIISVGETTEIVVETSAAGGDVTATIGAESTGDAIFIGGSEQTSVAFGYGETGEATFTLQGTAAGSVTVIFTDDDGDTDTVSITVVEAEDDGDEPPADEGDTTAETTGEFIDPPEPVVGVHLVIWGGGTLDQLIERAPANTVSIWSTVDGELVGYIPGARAFVNADFAVALGGVIPAETPVLVVTR